MNKAILAALSLALAQPVFAQTPSLTSPPGYLATEGTGYKNVNTTNGSAYALGQYAQGRFQQMDGEIPKTASVFKALQHRMDTRNFSAWTGMGRSWSNVKLHVGEGPAATFGDTFSTNYSINPTNVFSGNIAWPTYTGTPATSSPT